MAEMTDYIKIESYLKDVPDSFLMKEIQQATGEYPPVLIVAEYNRRKRMRNAAEGQQVGEPKSIVEDIKQEAGLMSAPGAMQTLAARDINQMGPPPEEMRPMPQQMPQQMHQMMPQQMMPMGMAGGGLVAFERGGPIRAQAGLYTGNKTQEELDREAMMQSLQGFGVAAKDILTLPGRAFAGAAEYGITRPLRALGLNIPYLPKEFYGGDPSSMTPYFDQLRAQQQNNALYSQQTDPGDGQQSKTTAATTAVAKPESATKPPPAAGGLGAFKQPVFPTDALTGIQKSIDDFGKLQQETPGIREEAKTAFEQESPDRISRLLEDRILRKTEEIQKDKDMSFNDALISAGAAILKSRGTPGSLAWMGEGLSAFGTTMKEGRKDIRKSEDLIDQANIDLASAQSLRDQGKTAAADRAENKAFERIQRGMALQNTKSALLLQQYTAEIAAAKLPSEIAETQAKTGYFKALGDTAGQPKPKATTAKDALEARQILMTQAMSTPGVDIKDPNVIAEIENYLKANYPGYTPLNIGGPKIRGAEAPATLPGT
jgi:hypothetical protein